MENNGCLGNWVFKNIVKVNGVIEDECLEREKKLECVLADIAVRVSKLYGREVSAKGILSAYRYATSGGSIEKYVKEYRLCPKSEIILQRMKIFESADSRRFARFEENDSSDNLPVIYKNQKDN